MRTVILTSLCFISGLLFAQTEELMKQADKEFSKGQYENSVTTYGQVIQAEPDNMNARIQRGLALSITGQYEDAISDFNRVIEDKPDLTAVRNSRGSAHLKLQNYDQAIADFDAVLVLDPGNQEAYNNRGWCKKHKGDDEGACADWKKSKKLGNSEAKIILKNEGC